MTFTDEDLHQLIGLFEMGATDISVAINKIPSLIARLEAAERCADALAAHDDLAPFELERIDSWHKAAGK